MGRTRKLVYTVRLWTIVCFAILIARIIGPWEDRASRAERPNHDDLGRGA